MRDQAFKADSAIRGVICRPQDGYRGGGKRNVERRS